LLLAALVGAGGGLVLGYLQQPRPASGGTATPLPAVSPSIPVDPTPTVAPYAPDIDYPPLAPGLKFGRFRMGFSQQEWEVPFPKGWVAFTVSSNAPEELVPEKDWSKYDELRFRPRGEPASGGYSLRVKAVNEHVTPSVMVADKLAGMNEAYDEVTVSARTDESVRFAFRDGGNHLRLNYFRWFAAPGSSEATLEMSVAGRRADEAGLDALFSAFASTLEPVD
jgi:hypothetical protein